MHAFLCANKVAIMSVCENEWVIKSVMLCVLCVLGGVPALPCAGVWAGTRGISLYAGLQKALEATSLDRPAPRARRSVQRTHSDTARPMRPHTSITSLTYIKKTTPSTGYFTIFKYMHTVYLQ